MQNVASFIQILLNANELIGIGGVLVTHDILFEGGPVNRFIADFLEPGGAEGGEIFQNLSEKGESNARRVLCIACDASTKSVLSHVDMHVVF